jgi:GNAT superfamily N-acetyltransferase
MDIAIAETDNEIMACFDVLSELRPHIPKQGFLPLIRELYANQCYKLVYLKQENKIKAVAGIRIAKWLHTGTYLEIEELITEADQRSKGYGAQLFDWVVSYAKQHHCNQVRLVSGVKRELAHKFYLKKGMVWEAKYFSLNL